MFVGTGVFVGFGVLVLVGIGVIVGFGVLVLVGIGVEVGRGVSVGLSARLVRVALLGVAVRVGEAVNVSEGSGLLVIVAVSVAGGVSVTVPVIVIDGEGVGEKNSAANACFVCTWAVLAVEVGELRTIGIWSGCVSPYCPRATNSGKKKPIAATMAIANISRFPCALIPELIPVIETCNLQDRLRRYFIV